MSAKRSRTCNNVTQTCQVHGVLLTTPCSAREDQPQYFSHMGNCCPHVQECSSNMQIYSSHKRREPFPELPLAEHEGVATASPNLWPHKTSETEHIQATSPVRYINNLPPCISHQLTFRLTITLSSSSERESVFLLKRVHVGHRKSRDRNPGVHK